MKRYIATLMLLAACAFAQAREVFPLNEGWRFFFKSENSSDNARHVTLPHTWNTDTGGTGYFLEKRQTTRTTCISRPNGRPNGYS